MTAAQLVYANVVGKHPNLSKRVALHHIISVISVKRSPRTHHAFSSTELLMRLLTQGNRIAAVND